MTAKVVDLNERRRVQTLTWITVQDGDLTATRDDDGIHAQLRNQAIRNMNDDEARALRNALDSLLTDETGGKTDE